MSKRMLVLMCSIFLVVPLFFMGCGSGTDGAQGIQGLPGQDGSDGAAGLAGPAGPITNTNESCMVCHGTARLVDFSSYHPAETAKDVTIRIDNVVNAAGKAKVSVHLQDASGNPITATLFAQNRLSFYLADLVPAGTPTNATIGTQSSDYWKRWAGENLTTSGAVVDNTDNANGNYVFTFNTAFSKLGTTIGAVTGAGAYDNDFTYTDNTHVQRLAVTFRPIDETLYNRSSATFDFQIPADGATAVKLDSQRMFVTVATCKKCHGPNLAGAAHGSSYRDTRMCVLCHSPLYNAAMHDEGVQASQLYHKIHSALEVEPFLTRIRGRGYVDVTFPQDVRNCATICHNNNSGEATGTGNQVDNWKNHPTAAACGSCHEHVNFATGEGHGGGAQLNDIFCSACHPASGPAIPPVIYPVATVHDTSPEPGHFNANDSNVPEFDVTLSLSPVKTFYVAGDNVTVTATLKVHGTSTDVPASMYTSKGAAQIADGILSTAGLYIYGPRALPKPIFWPTDNTQQHSLFVADAANDKSGTVLTDDTGFRYKFTVPSGLVNGTYMIRARFAEFGYNRNTPAGGYRTESIKLQTFQIGNATVTAKVAGDACVDCHGSESIHVNDHVAPFNTDECISCHDYSGGSTSVIGNRVHAVHSANSLGDMRNRLSIQTVTGGYAGASRNWDDITYPQTTWASGSFPRAISTQGVARCATCHTSGNQSYRGQVHEVICLGCHGDNIYTGGKTNHLLQNGGDYPKP